MNYPNLVGNPDVTNLVTEELRRCGINLTREVEPQGEVNSMVTGWLGNHTFTRAWKYWIVEGLTPLEMGEALYNSPVGKTDTRINGLAAGIAPGTAHQVFYTPEGKHVFSKTGVKSFLDTQYDETLLGNIAREFLANNLVLDNPLEISQPYIPRYHIDTELGLHLFVQKLVESGLASAGVDLIRDIGTSCFRKECQKPGAICWNKHTLEWYCVPCARKINHSVCTDPKTDFRGLTAKNTVVLIPDNGTLERLFKTSRK